MTLLDDIINAWRGYCIQRELRDIVVIAKGSEQVTLSDSRHSPAESIALVRTRELLCPMLLTDIYAGVL